MKKKSWTFLKQIFEELANERIDEIHNLSKQIDFNNLVYYLKGIKCIKGIKWHKMFYWF